jgi:hypothetical protein
MGTPIGVFPARLLWPRRCFSDDNSELTVGTHVGFPAHLQRPCRYFSDDDSELTLGTHVGVFPVAFTTAMPLFL